MQRKLHGGYIHGFGCITAVGKGPAAILAAYRKQLGCPLRPPPTDLAWRPMPAAGWIEHLEKPLCCLGKPLRFGRLDRLTQIAIIAAQAAIEESGCPPLDDDRAGVVLGTAFGSHLTNETFQRLINQEGEEGASPALFPYTLPSAACGEISIYLGLKGVSATFAQGSGAGIAALQFASSLLAEKKMHWMLVGGVDVLSATRLLDYPAPAVSSEGGGFLVLSDQPSGAMARVAGAGQAFGAHALARLSETVLRQAAIPPQTLKTKVVYQNAHDPLLGETLGSCGAAAPLVGMGFLLAEAAEEKLPALLLVIDSSGVCSAVCLTSCQDSQGAADMP